MNHQIQNDIHIGAAVAEAAEAVAFDKHRPSDVRAHHLHDRVEALTMPDLQPAPPMCSQLDQLACFGGGHCDGLLHQDVFTGLQTGLGDMVVGGRRHGDAHDIDLRQQLLD